MKIIRYEDRDQWLAGRLCRITGSRLKDIVVKRGTGKKVGFYELIAERIGLPADGENPMDRGQRLEPEAIERFEAATGKKVDTSLVIWTRDDNENVAVSPDGFIVPKKGKSIEEAVETKCLGSARHIEAVLTNEVPDEYHYQKIQYFAVNDDLKKLYFCFYDPRLKVKDFHIIEVTREQVQEEVDALLAYQRETLAEVERIAAELMTF
jgi:predicted phage-related endonuclease